MFCEWLPLVQHDAVSNNSAMHCLDFTLPTPAENLALDEALLDEAEAASASVETLRMWESPELVVVVGRSSELNREVNVPYCHEKGIPVLRRPSGGAAVVLGPGCLMYALVLSRELRPEIRRIDEAHQYVLGRIVAALAEHVPRIAYAGTSDLVLAQGNASDPRLLKCSGNSARVKRRHLLYHGTLLYDFPIEQVGSCLLMPPRTPDYRAGRRHDRFLANLPLERQTICSMLAQAWSADEPTPAWPRARTASLAAGKYSRHTWNEYR